MRILPSILLVQDCEQCEGCSVAELYQITDNRLDSHSIREYYAKFCEQTAAARDLMKTQPLAIRANYQSPGWVEWLKAEGLIADLPEGAVVESRNDGP